MSRKTEFIPYSPKTILNKGKRADHWFWTRYSAYPYLGCQHGCAFCYCRAQKYYPYEELEDFAHVIKVKQNAATLLRQGLSRAALDMVFTGDYQPAERTFMLSRQMLEVCYDLGFPVFILSRSPLVLRDLDLLQAINERARAVVAFSVISTPDASEYECVCQIERLAPPAHKRFAAMEQLARAGIQTGVCFMPMLPGLCDDDATIASVVRWTANHGGSFMLAGGLTLADQQREFFFAVLRERYSDLLPLYQRLYPQGSYGAAQWPWPRIGRRIRESCQQAGIHDRMPRPIIPGDKRTLNKRIVEALANQCYTWELEGESAHRIWDYRKAAWAIEDLPQDIGLVYQMMGLKGLQSIQDVGPALAPVVEALLLAKSHS